MKIKKVVIPTLTMVIIASQLMGCSALTQSELLKMINDHQQIEVEVAVPAFHEVEQGEESALVWVELAQLETNPALRGSWDDTLLITRTDTGKNGILYVNAAGENEDNNTLFVALHNREVQKIFEDDSIMKSLADSVVNNYTDIEIADSNNRNEIMKAVYMGINGYFNLLPDNTPNYSNADSTVTRAQFMAMVYRADTPVQEISANSTFTDLVGQSDYNLYSQEVAENSYLDLESKSLNNMTYNGNITRAEAIYTLISRYYNDELQAVNPANSGVTFSDAKDGGDIAAAQKFIEDGNAKDYWKSYELTYALQNADDGLPTDLYKALVVAYQNGLITTETRWDEAITLSEAMELLIKAIMNEKGTETYTAKLGTNINYVAELEEEAKELFNQHKDELVCTENQFVTKYIDYRNNGLTKEQAYTSLYHEFAKEYQNDNKTESGEAIAKPTEMDTFINSENENSSSAEEVTTPQQQQPQPIMNEDGTISIGDVTLSFPEGSSNGFDGVTFGGQATMEGEGVDPNFRLQ